MLIQYRSLTFIIIFTLLATSFAFAGNKKDKMLWWRNGQVVEELQLSQKQVNDIETIFQGYKGEIKSFNKELNKKENKLRKLIQDSDSTREDVLKMTDEINSLKADGQKIKVNMFWEIREVLTPKQRSQLQLIKERYMKGKPKNTIHFPGDCLIKEHTFY